jgi:SET domain-containing protein
MNSKITTQKTRNGLGVIAKELIEKGEIILEFEKRFIDFSTNKTLRIDESKYQVSGNPSLPENFINHSCEPNAFINFKTLELIALGQIKNGEEITYSYFTSDWDAEDVFQCQCGSEKCKKHINGFRNLSLQERIAIKDSVSPFLRKKLEIDIISHDSGPNPKGLRFSKLGTTN